MHLPANHAFPMHLKPESSKHCGPFSFRLLCIVRARLLENEIVDLIGSLIGKLCDFLADLTVLCPLHAWYFAPGIFIFACMVQPGGMNFGFGFTKREAGKLWNWRDRRWDLGMAPRRRTWVFAETVLLKWFEMPCSVCSLPRLLRVWKKMFSLHKRLYECLNVLFTNGTFSKCLECLKALLHWPGVPDVTAFANHKLVPELRQQFR